MRWTRRHRARNGIAGRDKLRERSSGRADERCRSVRQNRVDLTPQWLASSLRKASRPDRARMSRLSAGDGGEKSPILRGERDISRQAIAQGMSDVLRCPVCSCAFLLVHFAHETAGAARIRHSLLPLFRGTSFRAKLGRTPRRENAEAHLLSEIESNLLQRHCLRQTRSVCARELLRRSNPFFGRRRHGLLRGLSLENRRLTPAANPGSPAGRRSRN